MAVRLKPTQRPAPTARTREPLDFRSSPRPALPRMTPKPPPIATAL
eukprot:gene13219-17718_t